MSTVTLPRADIPLDRDGTLFPSRDLYRWMRDITERGGGVNAPSNSELVVDLPDDAGIEEIKHEFAKRFDALDMAPTTVLEAPANDNEPAISALMAAIDALRARIEALEQGVSL